MLENLRAGLFKNIYKKKKKKYFLSNLAALITAALGIAADLKICTHLEQLRQKFEKTICFDEVNQNAHWVEPEVNEVGRARTEMTVNMMAAYPEISKITFTERREKEGRRKDLSGPTHLLPHILIEQCGGRGKKEASPHHRRARLVVKRWNRWDGWVYRWTDEWMVFKFPVNFGSTPSESGIISQKSPL
ncbi:unnamed protein product [Brugia pahangi]|uniref:Tudor-knot domain-containing protein n=1 Tax=Brugia pahangi TaxID=6280 RepID=A0A0N4T013_BRUPA|nr:unnamed protein product [Brugia pahangi]